MRNLADDSCFWRPVAQMYGNPLSEKGETDSGFTLLQAPAPSTATPCALLPRLPSTIPTEPEE